MAEYIEREAAVIVCDEQYKECLRKSDFCGDTVAWNICADIKAMPAADVEPVRHGEWIIVEDEYVGYVKCSVCGDAFTSWGAIWGAITRYCPSCGARMDGDDNE